MNGLEAARDELDTTLLADIKLNIRTCDHRGFTLWYPIWNRFRFFQRIVNMRLASNECKLSEPIELQLTSTQLTNVIDLINNNDLVSLYRHYKGVNAYLDFNDYDIDVDMRIKQNIMTMKKTFIDNLNKTTRNCHKWIDAIKKFNADKVAMKADFVPKDKYNTSVETGNDYTHPDDTERRATVRLQGNNDIYDAQGIYLTYAYNLDIDVCLWFPDRTDSSHIVYQIGYRLSHKGGDELEKNDLYSSFPYQIKNYQPTKYISIEELKKKPTNAIVNASNGSISSSAEGRSERVPSDSKSTESDPMYQLNQYGSLIPAGGASGWTITTSAGNYSFIPTSTITHQGISDPIQLLH